MFSCGTALVAKHTRLKQGVPTKHARLHSIYLVDVQYQM